MTYPKLKLISHTLCPFVQRARIVLAEKQIPHEIEFIDLANKPAWFLEISPSGKVPVLLTDDRAIFESTVIAEYLDEISPGSMHPENARERARHRAWMEFGSGVLATISGLYGAADEKLFNQRLEELRAKFGKLERELGNGPYFDGDSFSLVDAVYGPIFRYFDIIDDYGNFELFDNFPKIRAWRQALGQRASVRNAVVPGYPELLHQFILRRGSWLSGLAASNAA